MHTVVVSFSCWGATSPEISLFLFTLDMACILLRAGYKTRKLGSLNLLGVLALGYISKYCTPLAGCAEEYAYPNFGMGYRTTSTLYPVHYGTSTTYFTSAKVCNARRLFVCLSVCLLTVCLLATFT